MEQDVMVFAGHGSSCVTVDLGEESSAPLWGGERHKNLSSGITAKPRSAALEAAAQQPGLLVVTAM